MPKLPSVVSKLPGDLKQFLDRVREALSGTGWDRYVTARELRNAGLVGGNPDGSVITNPSTNTQCANPPVPTGLRTDGAITNIMVQWDLPTYGCHAYTEVWAAPTDDFGTKVKVAEVSSTFFTHPVEPGETRYYWIRFVSTTGAAGPFNRLTGTLGQTAQDPAYLLGLLSEQITSSELAQTLNSRIDLIDTDNLVVGGQTYEGGIVGFVEDSIPRLDLIDTPGTGLVDRLGQVDFDLLQTTADLAVLGEDLLTENRQRVQDAEDNAESVLRNALSLHNTYRQANTDLAIARHEFRRDLQEGIQAEAGYRLELAAQIDDNLGSITQDLTVLTTQQSVTASSVEAIVGTVGENTAAIVNEQVIRVTEDAAIATVNNVLSAEVAGQRALIALEQQTRADELEAMSQQIALISAGATEMFDWTELWLYDTSAEGWTGGTASAGWLTPDTGTVVSPVFAAIDATKNNQVRLRLKKTNTPTWTGALRWHNGSTWSSPVDFAEPDWSEDGYGLTTLNVGWTGSVVQIELALGSADYALDWVAIGAPAPGVSTTQFLEETTALANSVTAEASKRTSLQTELGLTPVTNEAGEIVDWTLSSGLLLTEQTARSTADASLVADTKTLYAATGSLSADADLDATNLLRNVLNGHATANEQKSTVAVLRQELRTDVKDGLYAEAVSREAMGVSLTTDISSNAAAIESESRVRVEEDSALASVTNALGAQVTTDTATLTATITEANQTRVTEDAATASVLTELSATLLTKDAAAAANILNEQAIRVTEDSAIAATATALSAAMATKDSSTNARIDSEQQVRVTEDSALAAIQTGLSASMTQAGATFSADLVEEKQARVEDGAALASTLTELSATVVGNKSTGSADLLTEKAIRVTEDSAMAASVTNLSAALVTDKAALAGDIRNEQLVRIEEDSVAAVALNSLSAAFTNGQSTNKADIVNLQQTVVTENSALASAVTQLSSTLAGNTASIEMAAETIDGVKALRTVKIDNNGVMSGYGLMSEVLDDGEVFSNFYVNVDQFAVIPPSGALPSRPPWAASTEYKRGDAVYVSASRYLLCTVAGTSGSTAPSLVDKAIGDTVTDGGVQWTVRSTVPFAVLATSQSVGGETLPAGTYIDGAYIVDATITDAKIGNLAADKITAGELDAERIGAGTIKASGLIKVGNSETGHVAIDAANKRIVCYDGAHNRAELSTTGLTIRDSSGNVILFSGQITEDNSSEYIGELAIAGTQIGTFIQSFGYEPGLEGWRIDKNGTITSEGAATKTVMTAGNVVTYYKLPAEDVPYQSLTHVEFGECTNNTEVTIPGYFLSQPKVIVSPRNLSIYHKDYAAQTQALNCSPGSILETATGSKQWKFTPVARLELASAVSTTVLNTSNSDSDNNNVWSTEERTTPANTTAISISATAISVRGTGTSGVYYKRTVKARIAYKLSGGAYSYTSWVTQNIGNTITTSATFALSVSGLAANTYTIKVEYEASDTDGTTFTSGSTTYTYSDTTVVGPTSTVTAQAYSAGGYIQDVQTYTIGAGTGSGEIYRLDYIHDGDANSINASASAVAAGENLLLTIGNLVSRAVRTTTKTGSNLSYDSTISLTATATGGGSAYVRIYQCSCKIYRRTAVANSTTPDNDGSWVSYTSTLSSAQVLATGTLNWMAVGA